MDLFAGAGGWDEGLRGLGHQALGIELDGWACDTARAAGHERIQADVATLDPAEFVPLYGLIASPPCQAFSAAGKRLDHVDRPAVIACARELASGRDTRAERSRDCHDPRAILSVEPLRWALATRPRWIAVEQVPAVLELWELLAELLEDHGYRTAVGVLSAERYGVPQSRRRAFLLASMDGPVRLPAPTHRSFHSLRRSVPDDEVGLSPWVSMAQALGCRHKGLVCTSHQTFGGRRSGGLPRSLDRPSRTVTSSSGAWRIEPVAETSHRAARRGHDGQSPDRWPRSHQERRGLAGSRLTSFQAAALQGFRSDYPWRGPKTKRFEQIGNAVCPPVALAVLTEASRPTHALVDLEPKEATR